MAKEKLPYVTSNRTLAIALHLGGARIHTYWRVYTPEELTRLGMSAEEAARKDIGGTDAFFIEDTDNREALEKAFDETAKQVKADQPVILKDVSDADAARVACMALKLRADITNMRRNPNFAMVDQERGKATSTTDKETSETVITYPGRTIQSATASAKIKDYLKTK